MKVATVSTAQAGWRFTAGAALWTAACSLVVLLMLPASAQVPMFGVRRSSAPPPESRLAIEIKEGAPCAEPGAADVLFQNVVASDASSADLIAALGELANSKRACPPLSAAANDLIAKLSAAEAGVDPVDAMVAREQVAQVLRDADNKASALTFEVGPPPRHVTRAGSPAP